MLIHVGNRQLNLKVPAADRRENILKEKLLNDKIAALQIFMQLMTIRYSGNVHLVLPEPINQQAWQEIRKYPDGKTGVAGCIINWFSGSRSCLINTNQTIIIATHCCAACSFLFLNVKLISNL